nr:hypothetical protein [Streptomyces sp. NRRL F-5650]
MAPAALEERLRRHPLVHQAVVEGHSRPCVGAPITPEPEFPAPSRAAPALPGDASRPPPREPGGWEDTDNVFPRRPAPPSPPLARRPRRD